MHILVIVTGGTIGSAVSGAYIAPHGEKPYKLVEAYKKEYKTDVEFEIKVPYLLLSENLTGEYVGALMKCVQEGLQGAYDGIIVTHGTDTLQYSAAAIGYLTGAEGIPVMFVSSNYVLEDKRANGLDNFRFAVEFICERRGAGTFISYRNQDRITYIHRAARTLPHLPYSDEIFSIFGQYYGYYRDEKFVKNENYQAVLERRSSEEYFTGISLRSSSDILRIFPYPGMCYPPTAPECRAILLDTYHSGTICNLIPDIQQFFEKAHRAGIPVYRVGATSGIDYESVKELEKYHIKTLPPISPIAVYMKLWLFLDAGENALFLSRGEDIIPEEQFAVEPEAED